MMSYPLDSHADRGAALAGTQEMLPADVAVRKVALATKKHMEEAFTRKVKVAARLRATANN